MRASSAVKTCLVVLVVTSGVVACEHREPVEQSTPQDELESALAATQISRALRRLGGGHYHAVSTLAVDSPSSSGGQALRDGVTTTTDAWLDRGGQFRFVETNDHDGGREVVLFGRDLSVGLRYGKMIRRAARDPEPAGLLEEALGAPGATWEVARRFAKIDRAEQAGADGKAVLAFHLSKSATPQPVKGGFEANSPLRKWRETISVDSLGGDVQIDPATFALLSIHIDVRFSMRRGDQPLTGFMQVDAATSERGSTAPITAPDSEELETRQRTILEERALLGRAGGADNPRPASPSR